MVGICRTACRREMTAISYMAIVCVWASLQPTYALVSDAASQTAEKYLSPSRLQLAIFPSTGRGVQTLMDRSPGEILLKIPVNETITAANILQDVGILQPQLSEEQRLSMQLMRMREDGDPYVCSVFPKEHFAIWTLPENLWETSPLSLLPRCYRESFQATRDATSKFAILLKEHWKSDDVSWAFSMVRSRSVAAPELAERSDGSIPLALIPGLDLFNHQFDSGTLLQLTDGHWTLTSSRSYKAGEQIFLSYGDDKDNLKLLLTYGFATENNPNRLVFWTWEDLLDAAGAVRPAMFSDSLRQSLLRHPQLKVYVSLTEDRATFSFDTTTKQPRESLQTGLTMLSNLATQLGFVNDEALERAVLDFLIKRRHENLTACLKDFDEKADFPPTEWIPFFASIKLILEEELSVLATCR